MSRPKKDKSAEKAVPAKDTPARAADPEATPHKRGRPASSKAKAEIPGAAPKGRGRPAGSVNKKTGAVSKTATKASNAAGIPAKGRGRPAGSVNKKTGAVSKTATKASNAAGIPAKGRGRPAGSVNKKTGAVSKTATKASNAAGIPAKGHGRPAGSVNKKTGAVSKTATKASNAAGIPAKGRGRPAGSVNKKTGAVSKTTTKVKASNAAGTPAKGRGRPAGSVNKKTGAVSKTTTKVKASNAAGTPAKGRGRPPGTISKAITVAAAKAKTAPKASGSAETPSKKRGRPPGPNYGLGPAKKAKKEINEAPLQKLDVYVFGLGEYGELGLGAVTRDGKKPKSVRRPRLNDLLDAKTVGVVQLAIGGMHSIALTHNQKILTWGVNDNGALGRDTAWEAPERNADADSDSEGDDEAGLNPKECTPTAVSDEYFEAGVKFVQVAATDSASFALTSTGFVYGWGTFRGNDGVFGFSTANTIQALEDKSKEELRYQRRPTMIPHLKKIKSLAAGGNHVQALDSNGNVWAWGTGEQNQLGRKVLDRTRAQALTPCQFGLPKRKITQIASGSYHSFAIDVRGQVWAWGLSNFGQTGIKEGAGEDTAIIVKPRVVDSLGGYVIKHIKGGNHHSIACTVKGELLVWGRCDDGQAGIPLEDIPREDLIYDSWETPRILNKPTVVPDIHATFVAAAIDDSFAITDDGEAYSWGFSANWRTGQGTEKTVEEATLINNTAVKGKKLTYVGCGGQFSVLAGPAENG